MNLIRQAKLMMGCARCNTRSPFHALTMVASVGLVVGYGSVALCAIPAPVAAIPQDHDHEKDHVIVLEKRDSGDENVEVVVIQDRDSDRRFLLNKLNKALDLKINKLHLDHDENIEVIVVKSDEQDLDIDLHGHLAELLHTKGSNKVNLKELANQLREIADQLDGKRSGAHAEHEHHHDVEIQHAEDQDIRIEKKANVKEPKHRVIEFNSETGKPVELKKDGEPRHMIIELKTDSDGINHSGGDHEEMLIELEADAEGNVHAPEGEHKKMIFLGKGHGDGQGDGHNVYVEKIQLDGDHAGDGNELHFGNGKTSDEEEDGSFEALRDELRQLRQEFDQLRSMKSKSGGKRLRWVEERESGRRTSNSKKEHTTSDEGAGQELTWDEESDSDKSGNTFTFRKPKNSEGKANRNAIEFELKTDKRKSSGAKKKRKKN